MIDLMMSAESDVASFLERLTGGPLDDGESVDDDAVDVFFAMAGAQFADAPRRPAR